MSQRPSVMMLTGAYYPEASGAGLQCRSLIRACGDRAHFSVLTTALDPTLPIRDNVDGVAVRRVHVSAKSRAARWMTMPWMAVWALDLLRDADVIHLHGFSEKSLLIVAIAELLRKKIVVKFTSVGHDDPVAMRAKGALMLQGYSHADRFVAVSPRFEALYSEAGFPRDRLRVIPNGVDLNRFRQPTPGERLALRRQLGLPENQPVVLFVGFFSHEKCPDLLFDAWTDTFLRSRPSSLVIVGASRSDYYEIDSAIADRVRADAQRLGCADRLHLVEHTATIEHYYRAADLFALPSKREGLPNALLEAMACGVPSIVSRLPGVTDTLITQGVNGVLVEPGDRRELAAALQSLLDDSECRARIGAAGRAMVESRFSLASTATAYLDLYRELL